MKLIALLLISFLTFGCSESEALKEVQSLRKSGNSRDARERAIQLLREDADQMKVWLEFARASTDVARMVEKEGSDPLPLLLQAGIAAAAVNLHHEQKPPTPWAEAGRITTSEIIRQANILIADLHKDIRAGEYLNTVLSIPGGVSSMKSSAEMQAMIAVEDARRAARANLARLTIIEELMIALPGGQSSATMISEQLTITRGEWMRALDLGSDFSQPIIAATHERFQIAIGKATGDLKELGYFLAGTILENGVL